MKPHSPRFHHPSLHLLEALQPKTISTLKQIHSHFITTGLSVHTYPLSRLIHHISTLSPSYSLSLLFNHSSMHPSTFLFNTLISSLCTHNHTLLALSLYSKLLHSHHSKPNSHTFPSLLKSCCPPPWAPYGFLLHAHLIRLFLFSDDDRFVLSALLTFYSKRGKISVCRYLFDRIHDPDRASWNAILSACSTNDHAIETLFLFQTMLVRDLSKPNEVTLVALITACGNLGALVQGVWAHGYVVRNGLRMNCFLGTTLVELYSKCGRLDLAEQVFDGLGERDTMCYNAMIKGLAIHGDGCRAVCLFDRMMTEGVRVDDMTFVVVMSACAHAGLVDEGLLVFGRMKTEYAIEPRVEHYGCLVDLFSRAGMIEEAEKVVREMPMEPNAVMYRSLLGACRLHENLELGKWVVGRLLQFEPHNGGNYVLLSNMYADVDRWDDVRRVRKVMKDRGIDKTPGSSWVEIDGAMHEFVMGDRSHPCSEEIYAILVLAAPLSFFFSAAEWQQAEEK